MIIQKLIYTLILSLLFLSGRAQNYDVIIYGATPSGISAAVNAAGEGVSVALFEETDHVGGLTSSGLSNTDFHSFESLGGTWLEFMNRVEAHYIDTYGPNSQQVKDCWQGAFYEPKVAKKVFMEMIDEQENLELILKHRLISASTEILEGKKTRLTSIRLKDLENDQLKDVAARVFIDASYEGDLIAAAGCEYTVGSEGPEKYDESKATPKDWHVQCYNFRVTLTKDPENSIPIPKPDDYNPDDYSILLEGMMEGWITALENRILLGPSRQIPNDKADFNDRKGSKMSIKLCNETDVWPEASPEVRKQVWNKAKNHALGVFYFLQNDERVLPNIREEMNQWNLPKDEFVEYGHWPPLLYVREGRRLVGEFVYSQKDGQQEEESTRAPAFEDAVAIGDYNWNSHGTWYTCGCGEDRELLGNLGAPTKPWQVPYQVLLPKNVDALLSPVPISASRVAYGGFRQEPTWTAIGQAAGLAAAQAVQDGVQPRQIDVEQLQDRLHELGAITFYTSDVRPDSPYFKAIQYFGNRGLFQDLYDPDEVPERGLKKLGPMVQWTTAYPYHDIQPDQKMDKSLAENWLQKLDMVDQKLLNQAGRMTRGEFLNRLYQVKKED